MSPFEQIVLDDIKAHGNSERGKGTLAAIAQAVERGLITGPYAIGPTYVVTGLGDDALLLASNPIIRFGNHHPATHPPGAGDAAFRDPLDWEDEDV